MPFSFIINIGNNMSEAIANLKPAPKKTGKLAMRSFPTTTELPTIAIARVNSR
jgi:hypothetical protein